MTHELNRGGNLHILLPLFTRRYFALGLGRSHPPDGTCFNLDFNCSRN